MIYREGAEKTEEKREPFKECSWFQIQRRPHSAGLVDNAAEVSFGAAL